MLDVKDRGGQGPLKRRHHPPGHLFRRQSGEIPDHRDDRDADFREDIDRRARGSERADDHKQERENDEGIGAPQRDADDGGHSGLTPMASMASALAPANVDPCGENGSAAAAP